MSDKKDAVNIGVTLSTQLIAASLAMIAVVGTFAAFVIDKRNVGWGYYLIAGGAFFSFVISIFLGGKGIDKARKDGFASNWNLANTKSYFNRQALFCLLGIVLFTFSVFFGKEKDDGLKNKVDTLEKQLLQLHLSDSLNKIKILDLEIKVDSLQRKKCDTSTLIKYKYLRQGSKTIIQYFDSTGTLYNRINQ